MRAFQVANTKYYINTERFSHATKTNYTHVALFISKAECCAVDRNIFRLMRIFATPGEYQC